MPEENKEPKSNSDLQWDKFSELLPERTDVKPPEGSTEIGDSGGHSSLTQGMKLAPKLSDAQTFDKRLNPDLGKPWLNNLLVSRIFPELYNDLFEILLKGLLLENQDMTLEEGVFTAETALSIPIDGENRIEIIALANGQQNLEVEKSKSII